jgi:ATP synthase protein I
MAGSAKSSESDTSSDADAIQRRLEDLERRLDRTKTRREAENVRPARQAGGFVLAVRAVSELIAAVLVGSVIGWGLDWGLGTSPFLLLVFFLFGFAAGVVNVVRATKHKKAGMADTEDGLG